MQAAPFAFLFFCFFQASLDYFMIPWEGNQQKKIKCRLRLSHFYFSAFFKQA
jgi:hypothetical protein